MRDKEFYAVIRISSCAAESELYFRRWDKMVVPRSARNLEKEVRDADRSA